VKSSAVIVIVNTQHLAAFTFLISCAIVTVFMIMIMIMITLLDN
jgi:hypothetical protein